MIDKNPFKIFISYCREDKQWLTKLQVFLKPLVREGIIDSWDDTRIGIGDKWKNEINKALNEARAAILLISANFVASDFITNDELPPLLKAAEIKGLKIFLLIVGSSRIPESLRIGVEKRRNG